MELINPIGRNMNSPIQPLACYCASNGGSANVNFATGKGPLQIVHQVCKTYYI